MSEASAPVQDLEHREKQYDGREYFDVYSNPDDAEPVLRHVLTFVATSKNVHWLGPASIESIAQQIAACSGPSGPNHEYLEQLAQAMWKVSHTHVAIASLPGVAVLSLRILHQLAARHCRKAIDCTNCADAAQIARRSRFVVFQTLMCSVLQAKVKDPELYELHERVRQIRRACQHSENGKDAITTQHITQDGIAAQ